jgi:DNA-binding CsgD family transcriptional regulator
MTRARPLFRYEIHEPVLPDGSKGSFAPVQAFAERLQGAAGLEATWRVINDGFASRGIDLVVYMFMRPSAPDDDTLVLSNLPLWWRDYYLDTNQAKRDPFFKTCRTFAPMGTGIEFVDDHTDILSRPERRFIREASETGWHSGFSCPVRLRNPGHFGGWNFGSHMRRQKFERYMLSNLEHLQLMGFFAHEALRSRVRDAAGARRAARSNGAARLSNRERECLLWLAHGLRSAQIAERMKIATVTVELHFRRIRRKLGAATREEALAKAILSGEIMP